ncbi:MAG: TIGR03985 family CRISPR-associated protein [Scytonematopsis contorta HA4267-MV1]|jgi:CRISPR-associated protein (TIGR03985 family)|nr:TIGR03985 family CRISPR-associated protein [Scytonematopsis contorta HA4267-MV1]
MSEPIFQHPPDIEVLQWLAQNSLQQNLLRAIRLWVWLRSLYGDETNRVQLPDAWTFADWQEAFFSNTHPKGEKAPHLHDQNCPCSKTTAEWLFESGTGINETEWKQSLTSYYFAKSTNKNNSHNFNNLKQKTELLFIDTNDKGRKKTLDDILQRRLFAVTRRSLQEDLYILKNMGWVKFNDKTYQIVDEFPKFNYAVNSKVTKKINLQDLTFSNVGLETAIDIFSQPLGGFRRFFIEVDYIIPDNREDVDDCLNFLKEVWATVPIPPVKFIYKSAKLGRSIERIVYPVCIFYARRAIYLSAFGQTPSDQGEWYNYRLDRIQNVQQLEWTDSNIPEVLLKEYPDKLKTPEYIREEISDVWGYDFYEKRRLLVLRFERDFHDLYVEGTFRHENFQKISYKTVKEIINKQPSLEKEALIQVLEKRSPNDAYYKVFYRDKDVNIIHRLRSWRPNGEVLLPWDLRRKFAQEALQEVQLYQD